MSTSTALNFNLLISQTAYLAVVSTFFGIAIIAAISRTIIRVHKFRRLFVDDYFLFLAVGALSGSVGLFFVALPGLYLIEAITVGRTFPPLNVFQIAVDTSTWAFAGINMVWTAIFAVKFSFLFYFRTLVKRMHGMQIWWWCVFCFCVPVAFTNIFGDFMICPYVGSALALCTTQPSFLQHERGIMYYSVASDIVTDLLLISIPLSILRQAQFSLRQKFSIGIVLCLSVFMIAIAAVRGISAHVWGSDEQVWDSVWILIEACVSVIMVCMTAFRTLFVMPRRSQRMKSPSMRTPLWRKKKSTEKNSLGSLPDVEVGATMTGMRTMIRENGVMVTGKFGRYRT